eukprot:TRINITY_DN25111_c0_g3_i1.p1 TRINITY_DN25111_c0_g3~~TRINITY_DN25111_c0_g3_i1.p1  ORF type:complete len:540 (-),score=127.22 TRINITY_DN25111_c0_g3_i1:182-1801(-)
MASLSRNLLEYAVSAPPLLPQKAVSPQPTTGQLTAGLSTTVRVSYPSGECPALGEALAKEWAGYGDLARLDCSLGAVLGAILVTYFDVRCAQRVLEEMPTRAEPFPAAAHDMRAVRFNLTSGPPCSFNQFGEVANVSVIAGDMIIEYYDMRAAQALLSSAGSAASPFVPQSVAMQPEAQGQHLQQFQQLQFQQLQQQSATLGALATMLAGGYPGNPNGAMNSMQQDANGMPAFPGYNPAAVQAAAAAAAAAAASSANPSPPPGLCSGIPNGFRSGAGNPQSPKTMKMEDSSTAGFNGGTTPCAAGGEPRGNRPVRTKIEGKDFSKYDIDTDKIARGEDTRTTVMVRNLTHANARADFLELLRRCGLSEKYMFFYMPCKEHRNIPAGFAFVNFAVAEDVFVLYMAVKNGMWREVTTDPQSKVPAISYARFQGQEELVKHFSSSAVLHESDPAKRPIFRTRTGNLQELSLSPHRSLASSPDRSPTRSPVKNRRSPFALDMDSMMEGTSPASTKDATPKLGATNEPSYVSLATMVSLPAAAS